MPLFGRDETPRRRFRMKEQLLSIGDDYWIEDDDGHRVFHVDGKAVRLRDTWVLEDLHGRELALIREKKLTVRDSMKIELADGSSATVRKALVSLRGRYHIEVDGGEDLTAHGHILDHEYEIERDGETVAEVSKKWFRVRETYGVEVGAGTDPVLVLAVTVALDALGRDE